MSLSNFTAKLQFFSELCKYKTYFFYENTLFCYDFSKIICIFEKYIVILHASKSALIGNMFELLELSNRNMIEFWCLYGFITGCINNLIKEQLL